MPNYEALAQRFLLEHNQANYLQVFDELLAPDCIIHEYLPGMPTEMNRAAYEMFIAAFRAALPDIHNQIEDLFVIGDRAAVRWTGYGTHTGTALMNIPSIGNAVTAHGIYILRFEGGCIAEVWNHWDNLNVIQQLQAV